MKIVIIGNGGREHALCWKLNESPLVSRIYVIPGNGGTELSGKVNNVKIKIDDFETIVDWCTQHQIDLVIVGPEVPLANGINNVFSKNGIMCFGPTSEAARIESDKQWSKFFMDKYEIPTARWKSFVNAHDAKDFIKSVPYQATVIKASGLAAGKGVIVAENIQEACDAVDDIMMLHKFGKSGNVVIVEEYLDGEEVSVLAFSDGKTVKEMLPVQDHKRLLDFDRGPNTGGMGAFCPYPLSNSEMNYIREQILQKTINGLAKETCPFIGVLYAGLIINSSSIKVLEFNCRFGDPETQVLMPLLNTDLLEIIQSCCNGTLTQCNVTWKENLSSVAVVMASRGYPEATVTGCPISGLSSFVGSPGLLVFHAATAVQNDNLITTGGRVLNIVAVEDNLPKASARATVACSKIEFAGCQYRKDIAHKGIPRYILARGTETYQSAGVDISCGNELIHDVKPVIESTFKEGIISPIGSFGAIVDAKLVEYSHPLIVSGCDGVGTKLKIAQKCSKHNTIGQDLVAMCVNDILVHGAKPIFFLDYFACGKLNTSIMKDVISGIVEGCKLATCALVGGETAEMPGFYVQNEYDVAGFAVGVVEKNKLLPNNTITEGDKVIYLPSSGIHSNGFSLVRKIMDDLDLSYSDKAAFSVDGKTFEDEYLTPTTIYVHDVLPLIEKDKIKAFAHITGGGLVENVARVIPSHLKVILNALEWNILPVFAWIAAVGGVSEKEMLRTFNCGIGGVVIVSPEFQYDVSRQLHSNVIGEVTVRKAEESQVNVVNFAKKLSQLMITYVPSVVKVYQTPIKRVAVLISGTGTNLQALINGTRTDKSEARIVLVISSKNDAKGLQVAQKYGITSTVIKRDRSISADANDQNLHNALMHEYIDIVCLAGYMHILSEWFVKQWRGKMLNVHPSLLPSFKGMHAQKQALEAGVKLAGCTVHFVEVEIDAGAIIDQACVPVYPHDTVDSLVDRIKEQEHIIFPRALKLVASEKVALNLQTGKIIWK